MLANPDSILKNGPIEDILFIDQRSRSTLREEVLKAAFRFPKLFTKLLYRSYDQFVANCSQDFLKNRTQKHLKHILSVQFFLQKKIETEFKTNNNLFFLKLFRGPSRICAAAVYASDGGVQKNRIFQLLDSMLPGIAEIPRSSYLFHSPEFPYFFSYFELDRLRGKEPSNGQLSSMAKTLKQEILACPSLTASVFWPYNKEESHRQIQLLVREMSSSSDLPHTSIHFQEQTASSLEFLIHLVRPQSMNLLRLESLPESLYFFRYSRHLIKAPFPIEIDVFSIRMDPFSFTVRDSINLLYARRYLIKQLEALIGPFRDYNGGLFEKQQDHFESLRFELAPKIPCFHLFAEKLFYALHPFERWFSLKISEAEELFQVFSELISDPRPCAAKFTEKSGLFTVVKTENRIDFLREMQKKGKLNGYAQITVGHFHYECFPGQVKELVETLLAQPAREQEALHLVFGEGPPPSLNPHYSSGDMRCRLLSKLLFEGLTRLNEEGKPELAGAVSLERSEGGSVYTFHLRKAAWSNGEKVTALDYIDSWKSALRGFMSHPELLFSIQNAKNFREGKCGSDSLGIRAIGQEVIQVRLEKPDSRFLDQLSRPFFFPLFGTDREPKWFNGPYLIDEIGPSGIKLNRNPYFWKTWRGCQQIQIRWGREISDVYTLFKQGKLDWIGDPLTVLSVQQAQELASKNLLQKKQVARRFILHFNTKHPILSSVCIRKALSMAIDSTQICREIFPYSIPVHPSHYSQELALAYFEQGLQELKIRRNEVPRLILSYSDQPRRDLLADFLQSSWRQILNVKVLLKKSPWNHFRSDLEKRHFDICGTIQDTVDEGLLPFLERFEGENSWNFSQWSNRAYRDVLESAKHETDPIQMEQRKLQAQKILQENAPCIPLFDYVHLFSASPRLSGILFDSEGCIDFSQGIKNDYL